MKKIFKAFGYAISGFLSALKTERNLKIHLLIMTLVIRFGVVFNIRFIDWMICIVLFGMVISAELFNTAIEGIVDIILPNKDDRAKKAKDISASAVLVTAIISAIIGCLIFITKLIK